MRRQVIFKHYPWIALVGMIAAISVVLVMATKDRVPLVGSVIVVALGFCYFAQQQKLAETSLFKELFTEFNRRYDRLNDRLGQIAPSATLSVGDRQAIVETSTCALRNICSSRRGTFIARCGGHGAAACSGISIVSRSGACGTKRVIRTRTMVSPWKPFVEGAVGEIGDTFAS